MPLFLNNGILFKIFQKILTADISKKAFPMNVALTSMLDNNINDKLKWFASRKIYFKLKHETNMNCPSKLKVFLNYGTVFIECGYLCGQSQNQVKIKFCIGIDT